MELLPHVDREYEIALPVVVQIDIVFIGEAGVQRFVYALFIFLLGCCIFCVGKADVLSGQVISKKREVFFVQLQIAVQIGCLLILIGSAGQSGTFCKRKIRSIDDAVTVEIALRQRELLSRFRVQPFRFQQAEQRVP